jgi:transposase
MMVIGIDPHKQSRTAVAADELGRRKAQKTVRARRDGHRELIAWARQACPDGRTWAVEDVRHVAGGLVRELLAAGEAVVFVPPKLMAGARSGGRERGKSDPIDALAVARAALREEITLPAARLDGPVLEVRRLGDYRDDLVAERTRVINQLRWMVHDLDPALAPAPRSLGSARARAKLEAGLAALPACAGRAVALSQLARVAALSAEITGLEQDLAGLVTPLVPELLALPGVAVLTAAKILGEAGDIRRFTSPAAFARHDGTAPSPPAAAPATAPATAPTGSTAAATASSTPPSTASPWPRPAATPAPAPCWSAAAATSTRPAKPASAPSSATCPTPSTAPSKPTPGASTTPTSKQLDIGAS